MKVKYVQSGQYSSNFEKKPKDGISLLRILPPNNNALNE